MTDDECTSWKPGDLGPQVVAATRELYEKIAKEYEGRETIAVCCPWCDGTTLVDKETGRAIVTIAGPYLEELSSD